MKRAHVVGAGLAGLGAATALAARGYRVTLSEAARHAGGRCRSYYDPQLGRVIDNGNHLVLSGNRSVAVYLGRIGAADRMTGPDEAAFPFVDLRDGTSWTLRPNRGPVPWWIAAPQRRVPGTRVQDYLVLARLLRVPKAARIGDVVATEGPLWRRLIAPLMVSALNTPAAEGSARLAAAVLRETLAKGAEASRPRIAHPTLAAAFVDPALTFLGRHGATLRLNRRLRALRDNGARVTALAFADGDEQVGPGEPVILATPPWMATELLPGLVAPDTHHMIVNAHFACPPPAGAAPVIGVIGGTAEWVFAFPDRLSTTTSAADARRDAAREPLARRLWSDVARVHRLPDDLPPWQIVRERRATFAATPAQDARRPSTTTRLANLFLAGDWTQTGLPATIEGALRSGETAARLAARRRGDGLR